MMTAKCFHTDSDILMEKKQYKTQKIRPENGRTGLSYTVASIGFVTTKPERLTTKGALAPVTPKHTMKEGIIYETKEYRCPYSRQ